MKKLPLLLFCLSILSLLQAQVDYIGPNPGVWNVAANWSTGAIPTSSDYVRILAGDRVDISGNYDAEVKELLIEVGAGVRIAKGSSLTSIDADFYPGVQNYGDVIVRGRLIILNVMTTGSSGLINYSGATLIIKKKGKVQVDGSIGSGVYNGAGAVMTNDGRIHIRDCENSCFANIGTMTNSTTGRMLLEDVNGNACYNTGSMVNEGAITCTDALWGLHNRGEFSNKETGSFEADLCDDGIVNHSTSNIENEGIITMKSQFVFAAISNFGDIYNHACATISFDHRLDNYTSGTLTNSGWLVNNTIGHINAGTLNNYGVIEDNLSSLYGYVNTNLGSIITPLAGPLVANTAILDPLTIGSYDSISVIGFFTDAAATTSAGTYDSNTDEYTPNAAAVGLATLYVQYSDAANSCNYTFPITVTNPNRQSSTLHQALFSTYPNPCNSQLNIKLDPAVQGSVTSRLIDTQGRTVCSWETSESESRLAIPATVAPGVYMLRVSEGLVLLGQEKICVE
ncbi:MAG: T9SS type A sorting domain-containing protein [Bacteroidia bacterium]